MGSGKAVIEGSWKAYGTTYRARVHGERYADGGGRAIEVETWEPEGHFWEPWCTATLNFPGNEPPKDCVWIKEYDDNGTTKLNLVKLGLIEDRKVAQIHSGFVLVFAYPLTEKGLTLWAHEADGWFSEYGELIRPLPDECVEEVAQSGDNGPAVKEWCARLQFGKNLDQDLARGHILESGAHELLEVVGMTDTAVAEWVLWNLCWSIRDAGEGEDPSTGMCDSRRLSQFLKERVCKPWGYENGFDAGTLRMFTVAKKVHDKLVELHPDQHGESATDTCSGDHHRWCTCGFSYKWDSSD